MSHKLINLDDSEPSEEQILAQEESDRQYNKTSGFNINIPSENRMIREPGPEVNNVNHVQRSEVKSEGFYDREVVHYQTEREMHEQNIDRSVVAIE